MTTGECVLTASGHPEYRQEIGFYSVLKGKDPLTLIVVLTDSRTFKNVIAIDLLNSTSRFLYSLDSEEYSHFNDHAMLARDEAGEAQQLSILCTV